MREDASLVREFVSERSESAFAELVRRYVDLVYSVALRELRGDSHAARDAAQTVFCELARQAPRLFAHRDLSGWLYHTARFAALRIWRTEHRRRARDTAFFMSIPSEVLPEPGWKDLEPMLNDAMQELSERDREAVILRYFRDEPLAKVGEVIGSSENAARMRVERALEKLRVILQRRGIGYSSAALAAALSVNSVAVAPAGLAASITALSLASAASPLGVGLLGFMSAAKIKTAAVILFLTGTTTGLVLSQRRSTQLQTRLAEAEERIAALQLPAGGLERSQVSVEATELERLRAGNAELMRLRAEVTQLRAAERSAADSHRRGKDAAAETETARQPGQTAAENDERLRTLGVEARLSVAKAWGLAFQSFAQVNNGQMPRDFDEASAHYPELPVEVKWMQSLAGAEFEITHQGALSEIENPAQAIILRERKPFNLRDNGAADRTYLFADGHSEIHHAADGNFEPWEQQHQPKLPAKDQLAQ